MLASANMTSRLEEIARTAERLAALDERMAVRWEIHRGRMNSALVLSALKAGRQFTKRELEDLLARSTIPETQANVLLHLASHFPKEYAQLFIDTSRRARDVEISHAEQGGETLLQAHLLYARALLHHGEGPAALPEAAKTLDVYFAYRRSFGREHTLPDKVGLVEESLRAGRLSVDDLARTAVQDGRENVLWALKKAGLYSGGDTDACRAVWCCCYVPLLQVHASGVLRCRLCKKLLEEETQEGMWCNASELFPDSRWRHGHDGAARIPRTGICDADGG